MKSSPQSESMTESTPKSITMTSARSAKWIYLSHLLDESTPVYGGGTSLKISKTSAIKEGATANSMNLAFPNHIGTHLDFPYHFFEEGNPAEAYDASFWHFENPVLLDCPKGPSELVSAADLAADFERYLSNSKVKLNEIENIDLLLLRTGFEKHRGTKLYWEENPGISPDVGPWLKKHCPALRALGMDLVSVSRWQNRPMGRLAHKSLLGSEDGQSLILIEDMKLEVLSEKCSLREVIVLPLRVKGADGGPCTVIGKVNETHS